MKVLRKISRCVLGLSILVSPAAPAAFRSELYSESTYYQQYSLINESRLRAYFPLLQGDSWSVSPYLGMSMQYQAPGAERRFFENTVTPAVGVQARFLRICALTVQGGARTITSRDQDNTSTWDPRAIFSLGDLLSWQQFGSPDVFTEFYGESVYAPRVLSNTVSSFWVKQGYRFKVASRFYVDPYAEYFLKEKVDQPRAGVRALWKDSSWSVAALAFHNLKQDRAGGEVEGLLVVGGTF